MQKKHCLTLIIGSLIGLVILSLLPPKEHLYTELIVNAQNNVDLSDLSIFYTDINYNQIKPYSLDDNGLSPIHKKFVPYTEGFIPKNTYTTYKNALTKEIGPLSKGLQNYYETDDYVFLAFPGDLTQLQVIHQDSLEVYNLEIDEDIPLKPMYTAHMKQIGNTLILLAGEARNYNALIYTIDLSSLKVTGAKHLKTHPTALDTPHYTLTEKGMALFIAGDQLQVYNPFTDTESFIDLPFKASGVVAKGQTICVYSQGNDTLDYVLLDGTLNLVTTQTVSIPSSSYVLVDLEVKDNLLYVATLDPSGLLFKNYISIYNLNTGMMQYCLGLGDAAPLALVDLSLF